MLRKRLASKLERAVRVIGRLIETETGLEAGSYQVFCDTSSLGDVRVMPPLNDRRRTIRNQRSDGGGQIRDEREQPAAVCQQQEQIYD